MFPTGTPGIALLILRLSVAGALLYEAAAYRAPGNPTWICFVLSAMSLLLCIGFLTPIVSIAACIFETIVLLSAQHSALAFGLLAGLNSAVIALIGPGAYSVDAKLFGRREMTFAPPKGSAADE